MPLRHVQLYADPQLKKLLQASENFGTVEVIDGVPVVRQVKVYAANDYKGPVNLTLEAVVIGGRVELDKRKLRIEPRSVGEFTFSVEANPKRDEPVRFSLKATEEYIVGA